MTPSRYDQLKSFVFPEVEQAWSERDTVLYALGVGAGADELHLVQERGLVALSSMAVTLSYPGFWYRDLSLGLDHARVLHASERFELFRPVPVVGRTVARPQIVGIFDKGVDRGALVVSARDIRDAASGELLARVTQTAFCRGDGGLDGPMDLAPPRVAMPETPADEIISVPTDTRAALIYRLSGDYNPLHSDPDAARVAGFDQPILHGLSTYGHVCRVLSASSIAACRPMRWMDCRFTGVVHAGDTLALHVWRDTQRFRVTCGNRIVIDDGACGFDW